MTDDPKRPLKVFLCHAHPDADKVRALYARLKADGVDAWLDKENIIPRQDWEFEIRKAVRESDIVVVCLSKQFSQKGYRQNEVRIALEEASLQPEGEIFIIPARLEECNYLESLKRFHGVDLFEERGYEYLMRALRLRADKIGAVLQSKRSWLLNITIPRATLRKSAETKKPESAKKKLAEMPREIPNNKIQQKSETTPPANNFPEGWDTEWLPAFEVEKVQQKSEEKLEPKLVVAQKPSRKWNTKVIAAIAGIVVIFAAIFGLPWDKWFSTAPEIATATPTNTFTPFPSTPTYTPTLSTKTPTFTPTVTATSLPDEIVDDKSITMHLVPAGTFMMGGNETYLNSAIGHPVHAVYLDSYYIDIYEVTNASYKICVDNGVCKPPQNGSTIYTISKYAQHPVINVTWEMAVTYCEWRDARLPTEAEWEKAARGTNGRTYPWGEDTISCDNANYEKECIGNTTPVGSYENGKSLYGIYDMVGNVWEFVNDWYDKDYYQNSPSSNPVGPDSGEYHVVRGGAWDDSSNYIITARHFNQWIHIDRMGFRCARDVTP